MKERPLLPSSESFTTRQDLQGIVKQGQKFLILFPFPQWGTCYNKCFLMYVISGKITSLDTSTMRAAMKPGWEDLVRRCIQRFHSQHEGEISFAKRHHQEGQVSYFQHFLYLTCLPFVILGCVLFVMLSWNSQQLLTVLFSSCFI